MADADKATSLWMRSDGGGKVRGGFVLSQLPCGRHHRLVDRPGYDTTYQPDGTTVITRIRR